MVNEGRDFIMAVEGWKDGVVKGGGVTWDWDVVPFTK